MLYPLSKTKVQCLCGVSQGNKSTHLKGTPMDTAPNRDLKDYLGLLKNLVYCIYILSQENIIQGNVESHPR